MSGETVRGLRVGKLSVDVDNRMVERAVGILVGDDGEGIRI